MSRYTRCIPTHLNECLRPAELEDPGQKFVLSVRRGHYYLATYMWEAGYVSVCTRECWNGKLMLPWYPNQKMLRWLILVWALPPHVLLHDMCVYGYGTLLEERSEASNYMIKYLRRERPVYIDQGFILAIEYRNWYIVSLLLDWCPRPSDEAMRSVIAVDKPELTAKIAETKPYLLLFIARGGYRKNLTWILETYVTKANVHQMTGLVRGEVTDGNVARWWDDECQKRGLCEFTHL